MCGDVSNMTFSLSNFTKDTLNTIKSVWITDEFRKSIIKTLDLIHDFGFSTSHVQSKMTLLPIVYYIYNNSPDSLSWESKAGKKTRSKILFWLSSMVITGEMNTGGTVQTMQSVRNHLSESSPGEFPLSEIENILNKYNKSMGFDEETLNKWFLNLKDYKRFRVFLSLIYFPDVASDQQTYEMDHIFPRSKLKKNNLIDNHGFSAKEAEEIEDLSQSVANFQLIRKVDNRSKTDTLPENWLSSRTDEYFDRHLIPKNSNLHQLENVKEFLLRRQELMKEKILEDAPDRGSIVPDAIDETDI
jgi:hypothetical protein